MVQGNSASSKARYRLAKALEGEGSIQEACTVLERLLSLDADNADAKKLLETLQKQQSTAVDYDTLGPEEWAALSQEEQAQALKAINKKLDAEMGEDPDWDTGLLQKFIGKGGQVELPSNFC